jgi:hypothetical protein
MATLEDLITAEYSARHTLRDLHEMQEVVAKLGRAMDSATNDARRAWEHADRALTWARNEDRYLTEGCPSETHCVRCPSHVPEPTVRLLDTEPGGSAPATSTAQEG